MRSRDRVRAAIAKSEVDHPPVSVWRHFPEQDQTADDLANQTVAWQALYDWDFVKFMPPGDYPTIDYGAVTEFTGASGGNRTTVKPAVANVDDWNGLQTVDVGTGFNGIVLEALRLSRERIDPDVPLLQTIFSPLTIAQKMTDGHIVEHLRSHPDTIHAALKVITDVTSAMVRASYEAGANGIFFASQMSTFDVMEADEYRAFGQPYDLQIVEASRSAMNDGIIFLHFHGNDPMLTLASEYPIDIMNWHDRLVGPSLSRGHQVVGSAVAGGINELTIADATPDQIADDARDAVSSMGGRHVLITPGCVIRYFTSEQRVRAIGDAVRSTAPNQDS